MKRTLDFLCGTLSAAALFAIMMLTFFDVIGRKVASNSIPGSLEMTEMLMVIVIFAALPLVSERSEHVEFDSLDPYLPAWLRRAQAVLVHLLCGAVLLALGWVMWRTGGQFLESGETTAQLKVPKAPFVYGMGVLCAATGIVHLVLIGRPPVEKVEGEGVAL